MLTDQEIHTRFTLVRLLALIILVGSPAAYITVLRFMAPGMIHFGNESNSILICGLVLAAAQALLIPMIEEMNIKANVQRRLAGLLVLEAAQSIVVIKLAQIELCFVLGMAIFFITETVTYVPILFLIGTVYSVVFWPTQSRFTELVRKLEAK
jgi:hypothetical protein